MTSNTRPLLLRLIRITAISCMLGITAASAAPYQQGESVKPFQAKDQFENAFTFKPAETRFLLVTHDMDTGKKANASLTALGKEFLPSRNAVYMANIHGMPGIGRMFAMPKMKKYTHRIILADDAALIANFPAEAGKVTVIALAAGKVKSIRYWSPADEPIDQYLK